MYSKMIRPNSIKLFDVTLRDGIQSVNHIYSISQLKQIFDNIIGFKKPTSIEIGSIVSPKILPQMQHSIELFKYANHFKDYKIYMLTPTLKSVKIAKENKVKNFSLITSVSNKFQLMNINKTLEDTKLELVNIIDECIKAPDYKIKLYISCIAECPISGKINNVFIVNEILYYYYYYNDTIDEICLSDTCGTLQYKDFEEIINELQKRKIDFSKISLHLHNQKDEMNLKGILTSAVKNQIYRFDVSIMPEIGGCSVTMDKPSGNLSYSQILALVDHM